MTQWKFARIDRNETGVFHCVYCGRPLRSGRLIVIEDDSGNEAYAGPGCAKKHAGNPTDAIVDISKIALLLVDAQGAHAPKAISQGDKPKRKTTRKHSQRLVTDEPAIYLRLRAEHMDGFKGAGCS